MSLKYCREKHLDLLQGLPLFSWPTPAFPLHFNPSRKKTAGFRMNLNCNNMGEYPVDFPREPSKMTPDN
jgi:hypothetical protein